MTFLDKIALRFAAGHRRTPICVLQCALSQILFGDFVIDVPARTLRHRRALVTLRPKEFKLLLVLATSQGSPVSKDAIFEVVWKSAEVTDAALTQCMYRLRQTLARYDPDTDHIATVPGWGYRFDPPTISVT